MPPHNVGKSLTERDFPKPFQPFPCCIFILTSRGPVISLGVENSRSQLIFPSPQFQHIIQGEFISKGIWRSILFKNQYEIESATLTGPVPSRIINPTVTFIPAIFGHPQNVSPSRQLSSHMLFFTSLSYLYLISPILPSTSSLLENLSYFTLWTPHSIVN